MTRSGSVFLLRRVAVLCCTLASLSAHAAGDDNFSEARKSLRCAAFYVHGYASVSKPELQKQLSNLADKNLERAEKLFGRDKPRTKLEFFAARQRFEAELASDEARADPPGFLKFMGQQCARQHEAPAG